MKHSKRQFIKAFKDYAIDQGWPEILSGICEYKTENWNGTRMFIFQWQDGLIERKDTYHFENKRITLFKSEKRYEFGIRWLEEEVS